MSTATEPAGRPPASTDRLLARAAELIDRGWCRNALAEDRRGRQVEPWSESACRWSALGALLAAWRERRGEEADTLAVAYAALAEATGGRVTEWNAADWRTQRHVASAFHRARASVREARL